MVFATSAMSGDVEKSMKIVQTSIRKELSKQHPTWIDFGANLAPFWEGYGVQDGTKLDNIAPKIDLQIDQQKSSLFGSLLGPILIDLGPQLDPQKT